MVDWMASGSSRSMKKKSDALSAASSGIPPALILWAFMMMRLPAACRKISREEDQDENQSLWEVPRLCRREPGECPWTA
jgi:hypothetical protein